MFAKLTDAAGRAEVCVFPPAASQRNIPTYILAGHRREYLAVVSLVRTLIISQLALFFYVLGYIVNATTPNMVGLGAGSCKFFSIQLQITI